MTAGNLRPSAATGRTVAPRAGHSGHVRGATADPGIARHPKGWRRPGTHVPGVSVAGTFHQDRERVCWDVHDPGNAVVIELRDDTYQRLVIEVSDPRATVELIERAITQHRSASVGNGILWRPG